METTWSSPKSNSSPFLHESMVIWSNLAFIPDDEYDDDYDHSREGNYSTWGLRSASKWRTTDFDRSCSFSMKNNVQHEKEEMKLREELEKEIEKQLEQEIMEGILVLVRKLSNLKAKQIIRSLKKFNLEEFLNVLYGSSFNCDPSSCNVDKCSSPGWNISQSSSPTKSEPDLSYEYFVEEEVSEDTDLESTVKGWTYH